MEMYCVFCEVRNEFICVLQKKVDRLCGLVVRVPGYKTEMYCASCEVLTEFIFYVEESRPPLWSNGQSSWLHNWDVLWFLWGTNRIYKCYVEESRPSLWSSGQSSCLQNLRSVFDPGPTKFSEKQWVWNWSTQPREYNWGATWKECSGSGLKNREYACRDP
jgi:hypothetical protein